MENNEKEKEIFEENYKKQSMIARKTFLFIFVLLGVMLLIIGIVSVFTQTEDSVELAILCFVLGAILVLAGIIFYFVFPAKYSYEKYKKRVQKYGAVNPYEMSAKIAELEDRITALENKSETRENKSETQENNEKQP